MGELSAVYRSGPASAACSPGLVGVLQAVDGWVTFDEPIGSGPDRVWRRHLELPTTSIDRIRLSWTTGRPAALGRVHRGVGPWHTEVRLVLPDHDDVVFTVAAMTLADVGRAFAPVAELLE